MHSILQNLEVKICVV